MKVDSCRYSSCPQLAEVDTELQETFERTVDDISTNKCSVDRESRVLIQGPSPLLQKRGYLDNGQVSDTPTPPSSPKSRRSYMSSRDSLLSSPEKTFVSSPLASPRLLLRGQIVKNEINIESSIDNANAKQAGHTSETLPLNVENVSKLLNLPGCEESKQISDITDVKPGTDRKRRPTLTQEASESLNKCETWLQGLHITPADKIKSRSHIQLPPI